jgi:hypothetical protein
MFSVLHTFTLLRLLQVPHRVRGKRARPRR